jgi:hypothetical protein
VLLHPFQDAVDPARVLLVNHRFGVCQAIRPIRHQTLIFREPRLELYKTADAASPGHFLVLRREGCWPLFIVRLIILLVRDTFFIGRFLGLATVKFVTLLVRNWFTPVWTGRFVLLLLHPLVFRRDVLDQLPHED